MEHDKSKQFPLCFKSRPDFELWLDSEYGHANDAPASYCTDCLPSFKARMVACGRCEHKGTAFKFVAETGFDGEEGLAIVGTWAGFSPVQRMAMRRADECERVIQPKRVIEPERVARPKKEFRAPKYRRINANARPDIAGKRLSEMGPEEKREYYRQAVARYRQRKAASVTD